MTGKIERKIRTYTVQHPVSLLIGIYDFDGRLAMSLHGISSVDEAEDALLGDGGEYGCWDSDVEFEAGQIRISGADGPSGGDGYAVVLIAPQHLVRSIETESV